jgi:acyl-CoA thioesterase-1
MRVVLYAATAMLLSSCGDGGSTTPTTAPTTAPTTVAYAANIVFFGDSITEAWKLWGKLNTYLPNEINAGIPGNTTSMMLARIQNDVLDKHPAIVILLGGTNDLADGYAGVPGSPTYPDEAALFKIIELCEAAGAKVIVGTVPPLPPEYGGVDWPVQWNQAIKDGAAEYGYTVVDYYPLFLAPDGMQDPNEYIADRVHPSVAGFRRMFSVMWPALDELIWNYKPQGT